jgi:hypothetical protein
MFHHANLDLAVNCQSDGPTGNRELDRSIPAWVRDPAGIGISDAVSPGARLGAIATNVVGLMQDEAHREASFITFIATASDMSILGLGAAFWGIVLGAATHLILKKTSHSR